MDPLAPLLDLADVAPALSQAREAVDAAMRHRALRRNGGQVAAEASLRAAVASAALDGSRYELDDVRAGTITDPVVQGALRVAEALGGLVDLWPRAPRQVLAKLHVLAARGVVHDHDLGRLTAGASAGPSAAGAPGAAGSHSAAGSLSAAALAERIDGLAGLVAGNETTPPLLLAAIVHAELLTLRPFAGPSGVVARAAARLTLINRGFDPRGLVVVEIGHLSREPEYVGSSGAYATGTPDGVRSWLRHYAAAITAGAGEITAIGDGVLAAV
ncbi:oxidoreductase [Actinoplanes sp. NPDC051851]|uniref:oxidoreductase n=1 Tax=Actinoplanes sp. NPDC051851 TaxID=3154753 RepID=UPI0034309F2A